MRTIRVKVSAANDVKEQTLRTGPVRLLVFLQGLADPAIRAPMIAHGWSDERCAEGRALLADVTALSMTPLRVEKHALAEVIATCRALQAGVLVRARVLVELDCPAQAAFLFREQEVGAGVSMVIGIEALFARIRQLQERSRGSDPDRDDATKALQLLAIAGLSADVIASVEEAIARSRAQEGASRAELDDREESEARRLRLLRRIYAWLATWSTVARTALTRRDQLIHLGIAKRRARASQNEALSPIQVTAP